MIEKASEQSRSKLLVIAGVVAAAAIALYFGLGMPGMDHGGAVSSDAMSSMDHGSSPTRQGQGSVGRGKVALLDPPSFAARTGGKAVLVNVHVPFEGGIEGTQLSIPFDQIAEKASVLPADLDTPLLVYCRSGRMSAIATAELVRLGYRDVSDLDGGMLAWAKTGRLVLKTNPNQLAK